MAGTNAGSSRIPSGLVNVQAAAIMPAAAKPARGRSLANSNDATVRVVSEVASESLSAAASQSTTKGHRPTSASARSAAVGPATRRTAA